MRIYIYIFFLLLLANFNLHSTYIVSDLSDMPDDSIQDGIHRPKTLRAAIQNANYFGVATSITITPDNSTIKLESGLPSILVPVIFDGKGLTLEPHPNASINIGIFFVGNNSILRNIKVRNFNGTGIAWQGDDGYIHNVQASNNNGPGLNMFNAHRNTIGNNQVSGYYDCFFYDNYGTGGNGMALLNSNDNIIQYVASGINGAYEAHPNSRSGIYFSDSYGNNVVNCNSSGNDWHGIYVDGDDQFNGMLIENCIIGANQFVTQPIPNGDQGIYFYKSIGDTIRNNIVSGNYGTGISVQTGCKNFVIESNKVGTDKSTKVAVPNGSGIGITGENHKIKNNVISGNNWTGFFTSAKNIEFFNNIIGLDSSQTVDVPNYDGVGVWGQNIIIGDTTATYFNVIAGNNNNGIKIYGANSKDVYVCNNIIGTNIDNSKVFPNKGSGIFVTHSVDNIHIYDNWISAAYYHGIYMERNVVIFLDPTRPHLYQKPKNVWIYNNCLGCNYNNNDMNQRFGGSGIAMYSVDSVYVFNNLIYGADYQGIWIGNDSTKYVSIWNNTIGPDNPDSLRNIGQSGISISEADDIQIGYFDDAKYENLIQNCDYGIYAYDSDSLYVVNNIIEGIKFDGITIIGDSTTDEIRIYQNEIGPTNNQTDRRIKGNGIYVYNGHDVQIGNQLIQLDSNSIRNCDGYGLLVENNSKEVYSFTNSYMDCDSGGISLNVLNDYFNNGNYNDSLDADDGPNLYQNTPIIRDAKIIGDSIWIDGFINSYPDESFRLEVYLSKKYDDSVKIKTQGSIFISSQDIFTDSLGFNEFNISIKNPSISQFSNTFPIVTMTASGKFGTSPFSSIKPTPSAFVDLVLEIDSIESKIDEYGKLHLIFDVTNQGNIAADSVSIIDTLSHVKNIEIDLGSAIVVITDSIFNISWSQINPYDTIRVNLTADLLSFDNQEIDLAVTSKSLEINQLNNQDSIGLSPTLNTQKVQLKTGWNSISLNTFNFKMDMFSIWNDIVNQVLIVKNNIGQVFIPSYNINNIGDWNLKHGYKVYSLADTSLEISGFLVEPTSLNYSLASAWNLISYIRKTDMNAEIAFNDLVIDNSLLIAKDNFGFVFIPSYGINTIGNLKIGYAYYIYLVKNKSFNYPDN